MRRLFKKGERVRSKIDGKVMEVLKYFKKNLVAAYQKGIKISSIFSLTFFFFFVYELLQFFFF